MNKFDSTVIGAIEIAQAEALKQKNSELTNHHFLFGLIKHPKSVASKNLKGELNPIKQQIEQLPKVDRISIEEIKFTPTLQEWFTLASSNALENGRDLIAEVDFLKYLNRFYPQLKFANVNLEEEQKNEKPDFLEDLNALANSGKLDPVIGRSQEIRKVMEILCRRTKNNPVLVGLAGVGKTAIVEGLAGLIVNNQVPDIILGRTIYALQMGSLMSGTKYRGEFEEKIESMLTFLNNLGRDAILFIDEIHLLIGAGKTEGAMDAANLLKPALARGELNCIGATTHNEYKKYIETDSALERRFHKVPVDAPDISETIQILTGLKEKLEIHHGIEITSEAIVAAAELSDKYISDRNLPDKAIDLIDEAAAALKLNADSPPPEVQELESAITSKKILASAHEKDSKLNKNIKELEKELKEKKQEWDKSVLELKKAANLKKQLDDAQFDFQKKSNEGDFEEASRIKYTIIRDLTEKIKKLQITWKLTKKDIANVIHSTTGIPADKILNSQKQHILELNKYLNLHIFGQSSALKEISDTLLVSHTGLIDQDRTLGSFLLLGPSGVGKTETAKQLASFLFNDPRNLLRFDLSEYREVHSVAKLIGSPPGYIGFEKGGQLTEAVRRTPYCVVLFDEIEKAHDDFADILLQILDAGRLTDSSGRVISFKNSIIIVTSNLKDYKSYLKPELIGRFDSIIFYKKLTIDIMKKLIIRQLNDLNLKLSKRNYKFSIQDSLKEKIIDLGFDDKYGARPLKNVFNRIIVKPVAKFILNEDKNPPGKYIIDLKDNTVTISKYTKTESKITS